MKLIDIAEKGRLDINISKEKFFNENDELYDIVNSITWTGVIKPKIMNVEPTIRDSIRYEEIQFFRVVITNRERIYDIGRVIYSNIKYPCIIEYHCDDTIILGCCKFRIGKNDSEKNVIKELFFSHVLRKELLSVQAEKMISKINEQVSMENCSIGDIYNGICNTIMNYRLSGMSQTHVGRLISDMIYKAGPSKRKSVLKYSVPYKFYPVIYGNKYNGVRASQCRTIYDYEEIWYCFMMCPEIKSVIEYRRYKDIEDLIYSIDSKSW